MTTSSASTTLPAIQSVNGVSLGTGSSIFSTSSGGTNIVLSFKSLAAGPGASIVDNGNTLVVGLDYTPRPTVLNSTSDIVIIPGNSDTSDVFNLGLSTTGVIPGTYSAATITVDAYGRIKMAKSTAVGEANDGFNSGGGTPIYIGKVGTSLAFRTLSANGGISIQQTDTEIMLGTVGLGTVSSVGLVNGPGITVSGGPVTSVGSMTVGLQVSGVTPGTYTLPQLTVDAYGRITAAASSAVNPPVTAANIGDGDAYVYAQTNGNVLQFRGFKSGGAISFAETGTLITVDLAPSGVAAGTYAFPVLTLDSYGRITAITGAQPSAVPVVSVSLTGTADITTTATQTGSAIALTAALAPTGVVAGSYGSATSVPALTVDANGRVTSAAAATIPAASTTAPGLVQLSASTSSDSTTQAAASFAVKAAYDLASSKLDAGATAVAASKLATARAIALTGDVAGSASFDGSSDISISATLPATGVTPGYYVNAALTVDAKGRITAIANGSPPGTAGSGTVTQVGLTGSTAISVSGTPITASGSFAIDLTSTGVVPGTYTNPVISVDAKGRITSATSGSAPSGGNTGGGSGGPVSYSFRLNYAADGTITIANAPSGWTIGVQGSQVTITHNLGIGIIPTFVCSYGYNSSAFPNSFAQRVPSGATNASYSFASTNNQFILYSATPNNTSSSNGSYTIVKITI